MNLRSSLQIFADTGHHFHFIPFTPDQLEPSPDLEKLCRSGDCPWLVAQSPAGMPLPWIRARFTSRFNISSAALEPGVLLAVESNLGRVDRGWLVRPKEPIAADPRFAPGNPGSDWTPYAHADRTDLPTGPELVFFTVREDVLLKPPVEVAVELELTWIEPAAHPVDVDLIIDFGNTRTVAVAIEANQAAGGLLGQICRPIRFAPRSDDRPFQFSDSPAPAPEKADWMIDSWFILHEPLFSNLEPSQDTAPNPRNHWVEQIEWEDTKDGFWIFAKPLKRPAFRTLRIPQICVQLSPALLGPEAAQVLTQLPVQAGGNFMLSSPKRYLWDQDPVGHLGVVGRTFWTMYLNRWNPDFAKAAGPAPKALPKLAGTLLRLLDQDGRNWDLDHDVPPNERSNPAARPAPNPDEPCFPRSEAVTWAALTVLETAYRNIMSAEWRQALGQPFVNRRLRSVTVTFPPGWTAQELDAYRRKWQKAIDIFTLGHLPNRQPISKGGDRPSLLIDLDEAVASQLPLVFSEIRRLGNQGENWIELVGRGRGKEARARIMNIDIGGGTTDIAIIEYSDEFHGPGVKLVSELLYRDSSTIAGDALVRSAIEAVLFPAMARGLNDKEIEAFDALLKSNKIAIAKWRRFTRQLFIPIIYRWLEDLASGRYQQPKTKVAPTPLEILGDTRDTLIDEFKDACSQAGLPGTILNASAPLNYDQKRLSGCITETFSELFRSLAKAVEAFDCDLVFVSGKPSELPPLRPLLEESLPLLSHRIVFAKDAQVGPWYPLSNDGRINDAKAATVAGAALNQAVRTGLIPHWQIRRRICPDLPKRNYWGLMPQDGCRDFGCIYLEPQDDEKTCDMMVGSRIGRRLLPSKTRPEPVYVLRWKDPNRYLDGATDVNAMLQVTLRRVVPKESISPPASTETPVPASEHLEIVAVRGEYDHKPVQPQDLKLALCTMDTDEYWMDACIFHAQWAKGT